MAFGSQPSTASCGGFALWLYPHGADTEASHRCSLIHGTPDTSGTNPQYHASALGVLSNNCFSTMKRYRYHPSYKGLYMADKRGITGFRMKATGDGSYLRLAVTRRPGPCGGHTVRIGRLVPRGRR